MNTQKHLIENGLRTLGFAIIFIYSICSISARFKLFGLCRMDNDSLIVGFLLILCGSLGNRAQHKVQTPEQIINTGIIFLCWMFVGVLVETMKTFFPIIDLVSHGGFAGLCFGLVLGLVLNKMRPSYAESTGLWRTVLHFILTQMDFEYAFRRDKKMRLSSRHN